MDKDVLKKAPLLEAFTNISENEKLRKVFSRAYITNLCYYKTDKKIELNIECHDCVKPEQIKGLEKELSCDLNLKVKVKPCFAPEIAAQFEPWQVDFVLSKVKAEKEQFYPFLECADFSLSGKFLNVKLNNQSSSILIAAGMDSCIEEAVNNLFQKDIAVKFYDSIDDESNVDYIARKEERDAKAVAEMMAAISESNSDGYSKPKTTQPSPEGKTPYKRRGRSVKKDPNILYGRSIRGEVMKMNMVTTNSGSITIEGKILKAESRSLKSGRFLYTFDVTDFSSSLTCKLFTDEEELKLLSEKLVKGQYVRLSGEAQYDMYSKELVVLARDVLPIDVKTESRMDNAPVKRVELHLHTQMSQLDAVCPTADIINRAASWGHKAVAITDHGVAQAFPDAQNTVHKLKKKDRDIKVIYGVEAYFIANEQYNSKGEIDYKNCDTYHAVILVKNQQGLKNLYKIVSESHLNYFYKRPRIPKSLFEKHREGLIIGSACEAGELFRAIYKQLPEEEIIKIATYYDYLEIQPIGNNQFMVRRGDVPDDEALMDYNRKIVELGDKLNKPVIATCDVHFLDPDDYIYREILQAGQGYSDVQQAPLYFRTTEEMLSEFKYLGEDKAYEVVVTNTNLIAESIEVVEPIPDGTFPPHMDGAEDEIKRLCENRARELYGDPLPELVSARVKKELNSIIKNGFSVMYMIAQKLVKKSLEDGYLVGSRGSVGSSFVAYLIGITEVNSLPSHYRCGNCKYSEFFEKDASIACGFDLPEKDCPVCGQALIKDGYDIPFETFLGFDGDKEPDIDLNFSGEYQTRAHEYTEELFGKGYTFRAGTISTIADKTAYGFVKKYMDEREVVSTRAETERLAGGCTGVKRTTGQHPGGVMIVPHYKDIYDFTPIQRPADQTSSNIITTHFDYHSISGRILKLDILGHDDPTVIKMLEDLTGVDATTIPIGEKKTMELFSGTGPLEVSPEDLESEVGTFGVPEFGTRFVRQMLVDTRPTTFAELIRISGLSHGTDVWLNNAQDLVRNNVTTLSQVICTRDDIMIYLMQNGLPPLESFKIMESVRKGRGLTPEQESLMIENKVPQWYIDSCKKIKYMFPKAHAAAYVMMAFRIAWFKVYHPEAFYAAYLSVRADTFDANIVSKGLDAVNQRIADIESKGKDATQTEKDEITNLEVAREMYLRGIKCLPVDLYKSHATRVLITDRGLLPPFNSLPGLGTAAANSIVEAREKAGEFVSIEELKIKSGVSKSVIEILESHGCLKGLDQSSQLSLFSM